MQSLLSQGFKVKAYDVYAPSLEAAVKSGAEPCATPAEAANVDILGLMVVNALQVEDALFGSGQVAAGMSRLCLLGDGMLNDPVLPQNAVILCFSTVPPSFLDTLRPRLDALGKNIGVGLIPIDMERHEADNSDL
jgi:3-hydroxyisobutyrate dehydrogenase-like beta-hydroxyacid dehydrogenase